jgi:hypothetical protein
MLQPGFKHQLQATTSTATAPVQHTNHSSQVTWLRRWTTTHKQNQLSQWSQSQIHLANHCENRLRLTVVRPSSVGPVCSLCQIPNNQKHKFCAVGFTTDVAGWPIRFLTNNPQPIKTIFCQVEAAGSSELSVAASQKTRIWKHMQNDELCLLILTYICVRQSSNIWELH